MTLATARTRRRLLRSRIAPSYDVQLERAIGDAASVLRPRRAWALVSNLTQPLVTRCPRLAYHLLCVKDVRH